MRSEPEANIVDITGSLDYERYLYRCLAPMPLRRYRKRREYLEAALPGGLHKKLLLLSGEVVGQIEFAPAEASGYPITGANTVVMNCIWVLRRARGRRLGACLLRDMMEGEGWADGFATMGLEGHWSRWLRKRQMEALGFRSIDSIIVAHRTKHRGEPFKIHLMWLPRTRDSGPPTWDISRLLEGVDFCLAHPLYHPEGLKMRDILERCPCSEP